MFSSDYNLVHLVDFFNSMSPLRPGEITEQYSAPTWNYLIISPSCPFLHPCAEDNETNQKDNFAWLNYAASALQDCFACTDL